MREITPTLDVFTEQYTYQQMPKISLETRSGMFEYIFLWVEFLTEEGSFYYPDTDPVITSLQFKVRGRENLFIRELDGDDIERLSRENAHSLCKWRELHENGQGILLHLSDIGLTEEIPFPEKKRIQLEVTLLSTKDAAPCR